MPPWTIPAKTKCLYYKHMMGILSATSCFVFFRRFVCIRTCEEFAVLLLDLLRTFKLLLGMFLRYFVPQINRIFLLPVKQNGGSHQPLRYEFSTSGHLSFFFFYILIVTISHKLGKLCLLFIGYIFKYVTVINIQIPSEEKMQHLK